MAGTEEVTAIFLNWDSLLLALFVIGTGYLGLLFFESLKGKNIYDMPLYDKIIQSSLLGFVSFSVVITTQTIDITDKESIFTLIGEYGLFLFLLTSIICIGLVFGIYLLFYIIPNLEITVKKS